MLGYVVRDFAGDAGLAEVAVPEPGPGEVRLRIRACGLNFADTLMRAGRYQERPEPPFVLGMEVAGEVEALGPGVAGPPLGARVAVFAASG
ncbi:MAG: alcohol dehydrogenase catalytic domain-containing protein, partial [Gemmobacter sp.]